MGRTGRTGWGRRIARAARRAARALGRPRAIAPNATCPVCGRPISVVRATGGNIALEPHPQELTQACRRRHGTAHTRAELYAALDRRRRQGPRTSTQEMADLEDRLRRRPPRP